jgi:phosphoribosylanthranilate isomerase
MIVKICGLTNYEDARRALDLGAGCLGFVFAASPRQVEPGTVRIIISRLRDEGMLEGRETVGVFVNAQPDRMAETLHTAGLDIAQIHGDESPEACAALPFPWYRALRIASAHEASALIKAGWNCGRILVDALSISGYGGTGSRVDLNTARASREAAHSEGKSFFLAGGITPHNVADIIGKIKPDGIDLSSGVEESPGRKSPEKLRLFFEEIRRTAQEKQDA